MSVKRSHSLSLGIVGLPNSGKSTIFNALTKLTVPAENFPFCTIDKNVGVVEIPDEKLGRMSAYFNAKKIVPSAMTFVDIAGLVKGASKGEGLGNQFLSHIRETDVIMYVLRAFESKEIVHVYERVNPVEDFEIVQAELIFKDIEVVEKKIATVNKMARIGNADAALEMNILEKIQKNLGMGIPVVDMEMNEKEKEYVYDLWLLTSKKRMFVLNCKEGLESEKIEVWKKELEEKTGDLVIMADVKLVGEMEDAEEYAELLGYVPKSVKDIIKGAYDALNLITFYTGSEKECNAWTIEKGANAKEAAGVIHTDLENNFITADVVNVDALLDAGGWVKAKELGLVKNHGKDYIVNDGDYIIILANK
ncbi:TPA: redox-regulated ATPase YchF [Patescibacteria group bacterium]|nr:redox-regulated ATPase YchF [Patescibacteria group bacterium]